MNARQEKHGITPYYPHNYNEHNSIKNSELHDNLSSASCVIDSLRVIPQGTVDNNLGPDRLAGPKALDPNL